MKKKEESPKKAASLPQSIISYYAKYKNVSPGIKSQVIMGTKFEIDDRYEIIDTSKFAIFFHQQSFLFKLVKVLMEWLWLPRTKKPRIQKTILLPLKRSKRHLSIRFSPKGL